MAVEEFADRALRLTAAGERRLSYALADVLQTMANNNLAVDFSFIDDDKLRAIIQDYHAQALASFDGKVYAATVVLCGGVLEGVVTWGIQKALRQKRRTQQEIDKIAELGLKELLKKAAVLELLGEIAIKTAWAVKDFRNYIHPCRVLRGSSRLDCAMAFGALGGVKEISRSLSGRVGDKSTSVSVTGSGYSDDTEHAQQSLNFCWLIPGRLAGCRGPRTAEDLKTFRSLGVRAWFDSPQSTKQT